MSESHTSGSISDCDHASLAASSVQNDVDFAVDDYAVNPMKVALEDLRYMREELNDSILYVCNLKHSLQNNIRYCQELQRYLVQCKKSL